MRCVIPPQMQMFASSGYNNKDAAQFGRYFKCCCCGEIVKHIVSLSYERKEEKTAAHIPRTCMAAYYCGTLEKYSKKGSQDGNKHLPSDANAKQGHLSAVLCWISS